MDHVRQQALALCKERKWELAQKAIAKLPLPVMVSLLHEVVQMDDHETVQFLLDVSTIPTLVNAVKDGKSPLHVALARKNYQIACLLVSKGANVNQRDRKGIAPFENASWNEFAYPLVVMPTREATVRTRQSIERLQEANQQIDVILEQIRARTATLEMTSVRAEEEQLRITNDYLDDLRRQIEGFQRRIVHCNDEIDMRHKEKQLFERDLVQVECKTSENQQKIAKLNHAIQKLTTEHHILDTQRRKLKKQLASSDLQLSLKCEVVELVAGFFHDEDAVLASILALRNMCAVSDTRQKLLLNGLPSILPPLGANFPQNTSVQVAFCELLLLLWRNPQEIPDFPRMATEILSIVVTSIEKMPPNADLNLFAATAASFLELAMRTRTTEAVEQTVQAQCIKGFDLLAQLPAFSSLQAATQTSIRHVLHKDLPAKTSAKMTTEKSSRMGLPKMSPVKRFTGPSSSPSKFNHPSR